MFHDILYQFTLFQYVFITFYLQLTVNQCCMINTLNWLNNRELRAKEFAISREISLFIFSGCRLFRLSAWLQAVLLSGSLDWCSVLLLFHKLRKQNNANNYKSNCKRMYNIQATQTIWPTPPLDFAEGAFVIPVKIFCWNFRVYIF